MDAALLHLLHGGASSEEVAVHISHERIEHFGLPLDATADGQLAVVLTEWWSEWSVPD